MAYRPILEITAEEDLFSKDALQFLSDEVKITYYGEQESYDLTSYYEKIVSAIDNPGGFFEVTPRFIHMVARPEVDPTDPYVLFKAMIVYLKPKKALELYLHADPDKSSNDEFGLPEEYSLPYYKLSFDGTSANYDDLDEVIESIEGSLDIDGMYVKDENGEEHPVPEVTDDWAEIIEW